MAAEVTSPCVDYGPTKHTNPNIFKLEIKPKHVLCHEIGAGSKCTKCSGCPGLDLHFWRKRCNNCGCRMDEHDVILPDQYDHGQIIIGRLFGIKEQFENVVADSYELAKAQAEADRQAASEGRVTPFGVKLRPVRRDGARTASPQRTENGEARAKSPAPIPSLTKTVNAPTPVTAISTEPKRTLPSALYNFKVESCQQGANEKVVTLYSWVPTSDVKLIDKYMAALPEDERPIAGTKGEQTRRQKLAYQLPLYDCNVSDSRFASEQDKETIGKFVENIQKNVIGVGKVVEVDSAENNEKKRKQLREAAAQTDSQDVGARLNALADQIGHLNVKNSAHTPRGDRATEFVQEIDPMFRVERCLGALKTTLAEPAPCKTCADMINVGDVGIKTDHGKHEDTWHPGCFRCEQCNQLLVDMLYFYHQGKYYCGRHYADQLYPRCSGCDELIFANEYTFAEEKSWHFDHFACFKCDFKLGGHRYMVREEQPYCLDCFVKYFAKTCASCKTKIGPDEKRLNYEDTFWHADIKCFHCRQCDVSLIGQKFIYKDGILYCSSKCKAEYLAEISRHS